MSEVVIKVEHVGKQYHLGQVGTGTISHDFNRWWHKVRGKEDPYLKIGEVNDRSTKGIGDLVWALKEIDFEVKQGEVLGIIGKNGAGKSTLLKILSRVTTPSVGNIKVRGRIASLLEVGTGFHPELTGRENIFLNGAILGMTKREIRSKFDEIVDFSGVERYIDTPVKRYSSGMYVRLAFAVAAHLEPEILIVDEVLAVGDAEFQKKCLGKMKAVSGQGRTVLFVSHNMTAVKQLCTSCIFLRNGKLEETGTPNNIIDKYLFEGMERKGERILPKSSVKINDLVEMTKLRILNAENQVSTEFDVTEDIFLQMEYVVMVEKLCCSVHFYIKNNSGETVFVTMDNKHSPFNSSANPIGQYIETVTIPRNLLNEGTYSVEALICPHPTTVDSIYCSIDFALTFNVADKQDSSGSRGTWIREWPQSIIRPDLKWEVKRIE